MVVRTLPGELPEEFLDALTALRRARLRPEILLEEVPAPQRIAPHAVALNGDVVVQDEELATGRFVLLFDPAGQDAWEGRYRAVTFVRATLEAELGADPLLAEVAWAWLREALDAAGAGHLAAGGTVTRVVSESFGALAGRPPLVEVEIRASWSPLGETGRHLAAWSTLLCMVAGLPPLPEGVAPLPRRRGPGPARR